MKFFGKINRLLIPTTEREFWKKFENWNFCHKAEAVVTDRYDRNNETVLCFSGSIMKKISRYCLNFVNLSSIGNWIVLAFAFSMWLGEFAPAIWILYLYPNSVRRLPMPNYGSFKHDTMRWVNSEARWLGTWYFSLYFG